MAKVKPFEFPKFQAVKKRAGYRFPGIIVARYRTLSGANRYVVECTAKGAQGCQHIFSGNQLQRINFK
jgi:hypothetical protein